MAKIAKKASEARVSLLKVLKRNAECEKEIVEILNNSNPNSEGVMFGNITLEHLEKTKSCTIAHLQAFIHVCMWNDLKPKDAAIWPKKRGKADNGEQSYISWAYELRNLPVVLRVPKESVDMGMLDAGNAAPPPTEEFMGKMTTFLIHWSFLMIIFLLIWLVKHSKGDLML
jgi:hypothetical protein